MTEKKKVPTLFHEFPQVSTDEWEALISKDLKGADYDKKLVWKTTEGISVKPYYRSGDLENIGVCKVLPGEFPYIRGNKELGNDWLIRQDFDVCLDKPTEANQKAHFLISKGVRSLGFRLCSDCEPTLDGISRLLKDIDLERVEINFTGRGSARKALPFIVRLLKDGKANPAKVQGSADLSPLSSLTLTGNYCCGVEQSYLNLKNAVESVAGISNFRVIGINAYIFHNSGSSIVQELAFAISMANDYLQKLTDLGLSVDAVASRMRFNFSVGSSYFMEIAKFRAARLLWAKVVEAYTPGGVEVPPMSIHAETSRWNMTVYDPYVNMLRSTTEGMSAVLSGVDSLNILPFDDPFQDATVFSERVARNQQLILKEESYFGKVADPSAGSYYIENLTMAIAEEAWRLFLQLDEMGGYVEALTLGFIQGQIREVARKRDINFTTRRETILGTNQYPNFSEIADPNAIRPEAVNRKPVDNPVDARVEPLAPYRGAQAFEELRYRTDASGRRPRVFMLTVGGHAMPRARAQFSCNFFAIAGFEVVDNIGFKTVDEGVKAAAEAKSDIVVICSSDDEYLTLAPEAFEKIGNKAILVVAGEPACKPALEAKGIKNFISTKSNVLDTLNHYYNLLNI